MGHDKKLRKRIVFAFSKISDHFSFLNEVFCILLKPLSEYTYTHRDCCFSCLPSSKIIELNYIYTFSPHCLETYLIIVGEAFGPWPGTFGGEQRHGAR